MQLSRILIRLERTINVLVSIGDGYSFPKADLSSLIYLSTDLFMNRLGIFFLCFIDYAYFVVETLVEVGLLLFYTRKLLS